MLSRTEFTVESLRPHPALEKLRRAGIDVFHARLVAKNRMTFEVESRNTQKVFAILRGTCYNILRTRDRGPVLLYKKCLGRIGLLAGALLFCAAVCFAQTRVLTVRVTGSGAYYEAEVREALAASGIGFFSKAPKGAEEITAKILSLPRVSYCSIGHSGGVLTVEVRVSDEGGMPAKQPLTAPVAGTVEELVVLRGTARIAVGDRVEAGQILVDCVAVCGETEREVFVIARARIAYPVSEIFSGTEREARAAAYLKYGEIGEMTLERTADGWLVRGTAHKDAAINLH